MGYPDLGTWNEKRPNEAEDDAVAIAEQLAWTAIDSLTAGRVSFTPIVVRPVVTEADGSIALPGPVGGVTRVRIDGVTFSGWLLDGDRLMRMDGGSWPTNDDLTLSTGAVGVFEITYHRGWRPGRLLTWAAAELASEFYKAASGDKKCRLPKNVTTVTRQGVSFDMQTPLFDHGRTGIHEIDVVLTRYNPMGAKAGVTVASPESIARAPRRY